MESLPVHQAAHESDDDTEYFYNKEFVSQITKFSNFKQAAEFIVNWIKVQKHNATEFTDDLPGLLERLCEIRHGALTNPEGATAYIGKITLLECEGSESDFIVKFMLNLFEQCSLLESVPSLISRVIINNLATQISNQEIQLTNVQKEFALSKLEAVRGEMIFDFVAKLGLTELVDAEYFRALALTHIGKNKYNEAAMIVHRFSFKEGFDIKMIIDRLVDSNKIQNAKLLCENNREFVVYLINILSTNDNAKQAAGIIQDFIYQSQIYKNSYIGLNYYAGKHYSSLLLFIQREARPWPTIVALSFPNPALQGISLKLSSRFTPQFNCLNIIYCWLKSCIPIDKLPLSKNYWHRPQFIRSQGYPFSFKLDINDFPALKERLLKSSMRYYLGRYLYKKKGKDDDYLSLDRIEDLFSGFKTMLSYLVEDLMYKGKPNDAKGVCIRHQLFETIRPSTKEQLESVVYDPSQEPIPFDVFGPLTQDKECIKLPDHVQVQWISTAEDIPKLNQLLTEPFIGVDAEWRPSVAKFHKTAPAVFQVSGAQVIRNNISHNYM